MDDGGQALSGFQERRVGVGEFEERLGEVERALQDGGRGTDVA
ncbi:hypothetical protein [Streptomyces sp. CBMA123]|nr:hypothetical protein [Streptomyces sp. CBMA123]